MTVLVNHKDVIIDESAKLDDLIKQLNLSSEGVALAIDNQVIPKKSWAEFELKDQMKVTLIRATQGG